MKREILFRGKKIENGEWVYGRGLQQCKDELGNEIVAIFTDVVKSEKYIKKEGRYTLYYAPVKAETLGQYTGLKDKNGVKIFEGDIISIGDPNIKYIIMWRNDGFCAKQIGASSYIGLTYWASDIEVLGNVIDNPELIK